MKVLEVKSLKKSFGGLKAVDGVSFEVEEGEILGVIGPNGSGKTTLFNMIGGSFAPTSGKVIYNGEDVTGWPAYKLYEHGLIRTFQLSQEYPLMTSMENLVVAGLHQTGETLIKNWISPSQVREREEEVIEKAYDTIDFLGLEHLTDEYAGNLSGGQKKLLELGRAMMHGNAKVVLLDEIGAGINPTLMVKVMDMIRRLNTERGYTFCVIEHDMDMIADLCERTLVLVDGKILTQGAMDDLRQDDRVIDAYFGGGEPA